MQFTNRFLIMIIVAISIYAIFLMLSDFTAIWDKMSHFKIQFLPIILVLVPCSWLALLARWILLLRNTNVIIPFKQNLKIYFAGYALAITPGKFGELIKSQLMKTKFNIPHTTTAPLVLIERLYDLVGAVAVSFVGVWTLGIGSYVIIAASIVLGFAFLIISSHKIFEKFVNSFGKIKFTSKLIKPFYESYEIMRSSSRGKIVVLASSCTVVYWFLESLGVYFILLAFGIDSIHYLNVVSTYASSLILGALSFIPGGIGVAEGSLVGLLSLQGIEISNVFVLVVLIRIFTLWYSVSVGFVALKLSGGFSIQSKTI